MSDQPATNPAGDAGAVTPSPVAPQPATPASPRIDGSTLIDVSMDDGTTETLSMTQLADAHRNKLPEDSQKRFELYQKAVEKNDPEAMAELMTSLGHTPATDPVDVNSLHELVKDLTTKVTDLQGNYNQQVTPLMGQLSDARLTQQVGVAIGQNQKSYPYLSQLQTANAASAASVVKQQLKSLESIAEKQYGLEAGSFSPEVRANLNRAAFAEAERHVQGLASAFGGQVTETVPTTPDPGEVPVTGGTPTAPVKKVESIPASIQLNAQGQIIPPSGPAPVVPSTPITPASSPAMPGINPEPVKQDWSPKGFMANMRQRISGQVGPN